MKRINISVNLEDNEVFEESFKQAFIGQAKQIAREELDKELSAEIERITTVKLNEIKSSGYYNTITSRITDSIVQRLDRELRVNTSEINVMIEEKINEYLDNKIKQNDGFDSFIQKYVDQSVGNLLLQRTKNNRG